ncbi:MAG: 1,4-alpha-glucan branching protein GlgB [Clostridia bacterium]|nr:1,4-alpha-glucan branching protein GlgB [Clostridia bacterium]
MRENNSIIRGDSEISKELMFLFNEGKNFQSYNILGAHKANGGYMFAVWAPNAVSVSVVCDQNGWDRTKNPMRLYFDTGIWTAFVEGVMPGEKYKYSIETVRGELLMKADPFAFESETRPDTASVAADMDYSWKDAKWLKTRETTAPYDKPINIYELHFGSWKQHDDGSFYTYTEMADALIPYIKEMGYTHIELMPICEYPFDGSWGYQIGGYFSANSRYGKPAELKAFIDKCHGAGISVIMDWVPAHFPRDAHGLARFDGSCLYEHPDSRLGEHKEWGTLVFNWERYEIHSFLISNAVFWLDEYHIDGLRVDAVSSMLYLDYNRRDGEWIPNKYGGKENLAAIDFLQKLNVEIFNRFPNVMMIAEESTAWGGVTVPVHEGGLGFNFKWNMGWMNDILRYMSMDPYFRGSNHNMLTFSMMYAYSENYILPLSHDEVVHGKGSLINKMYGSYEQKFKSLKLLYAYMYAHPGKKLLFMGGEIAQFIEWRFAEGLEWKLLDFDTHRGVQNFVKALNTYYKTNKSMHENDTDWSGFEWINAEDGEHSVVSFIRTSLSKRDKTIVVANFAAQRHEGYEVEVPASGDYEIVLNTEDKSFGGEENGKKIFRAKKKKNGKLAYSISVDLPELSAVYIKKKPKTKIKN